MDGHFAIVICKDGGEVLPGLFYSYRGRLFMTGVKEAKVLYALDADARRELAPS